MHPMSNHREETFEKLYNANQKILKANYEQGVRQTEVVMKVIKLLRSTSAINRAEVAAKMLEDAWAP
jgi:hypothetical protein